VFALPPERHATPPSPTSPQARTSRFVPWVARKAEVYAITIAVLAVLELRSVLPPPARTHRVRPATALTSKELAVRLCRGNQANSRKSVAANEPYPRLVLQIDVGEVLPGAVGYDQAGVQFLDRPGRREAAIWHKPKINFAYWRIR
jgi:hypothetical protein